MDLKVNEVKMTGNVSLRVVHFLFILNRPCLGLQTMLWIHVSSQDG